MVELKQFPDEGDAAFEKGDFGVAEAYWRMQLQAANATNAEAQSNLVTRLARALICQRKYEELEKLLDSFPQPVSLINAVHVSILGETLGGNFQKVCALFRALLGDELVTQTLDLLNGGAADREELTVQCRLHSPLFNWNWYDPLAELFFKYFSVMLSGRLRQEGQYKAAAEIFKEFALILPSNPFPLACLFEVQVDNGDYLQAENTLLRLKNCLRSTNEREATFFQVAILCYEAEILENRGELALANQGFIKALSAAKVQSFGSTIVQSWSQQVDFNIAAKEGRSLALAVPESLDAAPALLSLSCYRNFQNRCGNTTAAYEIERLEKYIEQSFVAWTGGGFESRE